MSELTSMSGFNYAKNMNVNVIRTLKEKGSRSRMINVSSNNQNSNKINAFIDKQLLPAGPLKQFKFDDATKFCLNDKMRHSFDVEANGMRNFGKSSNYYLRMKKNNGHKTKKKGISPYRNEDNNFGCLVDVNSSLVKEIKESIKVSLNLSHEIEETLYKPKRNRELSDDSLIILDKYSINHDYNNRDEEFYADKITEHIKRNQPNTIVTKITIEKDAMRMSSDIDEDSQDNSYPDPIRLDIVSNSQYELKSLERPPKFQNTSLISNPYLNPSGYPNHETYSLTQKAGNVKWNERGKFCLEENKLQSRRERNLMVLSRNLRNISYLKSPNPAIGGKAINSNLDLNLLDSLSSSDFKIPLLFSETNMYEEFNSQERFKEADSKYKARMKNQKSNIPESISISTIVNRNEGKALARLSNAAYPNDSFKDTVSPFSNNIKECKMSKSPYDNCGKTFNFDNQQSVNTIDNNASQSTIKSGRMDSKSIIIPRKKNNDYIKVTESIAHNIAVENTRNSGNKRNSYRTDLQMKSHNISKSQLPTLTCFKKDKIEDLNEQNISESPNKIKIKVGFLQNSLKKIHNKDKENNQYVVAVFDNADVAK